MSNIFLFGCKISSRKYARKGRVLKNVLSLWFSQTGHTERHGKLIAHVWEKMGLKVASSEIREFTNRNLNDFDLILIGTPVFYYDIPEYVTKWINSIQQLNGTPVASFVTYGGPEGDQHNAASTILELLSEKGGVPVGMETFMNMGTMPTVWSEDKISENVWNNRFLPNEETYQRVRAYAHLLINQVKQGNPIEVNKKMTLRRFATIFNPIFWTKRIIEEHAIDKDNCIQCNTCANKCPADAIDPSNYTVYRDRCVLCFGCLNNCPQQATIMIYRGRKLFGFRELLRRKKIKIKEPEEFQGTRVAGEAIGKRRKEAKRFPNKSSQPTSYLGG
jgi:ferredoxin/flavodoxin